MNLDEAVKFFARSREQVRTERRARLSSHCDRVEASFGRLRLPTLPSGIWARLLSDDVKRLLSHYALRKRDCDAARRALEEFDVAHRRSDPVLMRSIDEEAARRCDEIDIQIGSTLREYQRGKRIERERQAALAKYNFDTGEEHSFAQSAPHGSKSKHEATLVGPIELADEIFAKTTGDRGRSFILYPWLEEMVRYQRRGGWFWHTSDGRFQFAPLVATKPPIPLDDSPEATQLASGPTIEVVPKRLRSADEAPS